jgi:hypothetical protein
MSTNRSENGIAAIEMDMRDVFRAKKLRTMTTENKGAKNDFSELVFGISNRSAEEIDQLVEGLRQVREKLDTDGNRLQSELAKYAEFSETVMQLTKIVSDSMGHVQGASPAKIN